MVDSAAAALAVITTLRAAGHEAFLVGGCVRDQLLGRPVHDHDVATSAHPDQVLALFPRTIAVGKAFGVVVVVGPGEVSTEVATYRADGVYIDGRRPTDVVFTTAAGDVARRDFTVNALLQDPVTGAIIDHVGGRADLQQRILRAVGDPLARLREDRLRVLRALRFAAVLGFTIEPVTWAAVLSTTLDGISRERVLEEWRKALSAGAGPAFLRLLDQSGHLQEVTPGAATTQVDLLAKLATAPVLVQVAAWLLPLGAAGAQVWLNQEPVPVTWRRDLPWLITWGPRLRDLDQGQRRRLLRDPRGEALAALAVALGDVPGADTDWLGEARRYPACPVTATVLLAAGLPPGPALGSALEMAQVIWFNGFSGSSQDLTKTVMTAL